MNSTTTRTSVDTLYVCMHVGFNLLQASGNNPNDNVEIWIKSLEEMIRKKKQNGDDSNGMAAIHFAAWCTFQVEQPTESDMKLSSLEAKEFLQPQ